MPYVKRETMTPIKSAALLAIAVVFSVIAPAATPASAKTYPIECAQRDVQVVTQLEQYGEAQAVPGEILYEAFWILTHARQVCAVGGSWPRSRSTTASSRHLWPAGSRRIDEASRPPEWYPPVRNQ